MGKIVNNFLLSTRQSVVSKTLDPAKGFDFTSAAEVHFDSTERTSLSSEATFKLKALDL